MANTIPIGSLHEILGDIQGRVLQLTGQTIQTLSVSLAEAYRDGTEREKAEIVSQLVDGLRMLDPDKARAAARKATVPIISARVREKQPGVLITQIADPFVDRWMEADDAQRDSMVETFLDVLRYGGRSDEFVAVAESEPEEKLDATMREAIAEGARTFYLASYSIELDDDEIEGIIRSIEYAWQRKGARG